MSESKSEIKRWTAKRKTQVVVDILKRKTMVTEAARRHDLEPAEIECWLGDGLASHGEPLHDATAGCTRAL